MESALALEDLRVGDELGRYELVCVLAQGGMGAVWLARMRGLHGFERLVALKTILPAYGADEHFRAMFLEEARIASRVNHENVVGIIDVGEERDVLYFTMDYVEGEPLKRLHKKALAAGAAFPAGIALRLAAEACAGLHAAHGLRDDDGVLLEVVHRDVSPQNVLVTPRGNVKVIDFGVARARDRAAHPTAAGTLKGKVHYMAPEQALGVDLDRRADVYAMGAVLYQLLSGRAVHEGRDGGEIRVLQALLSGLPPAPLPAEVPRAVAAVVERALAYEPARRYQTMDEMRAAIEAAALESGVHATTDDVARFFDVHAGARMRQRRDAVAAAIGTVRRRKRDASSSGARSGAWSTSVRDVPSAPLSAPSAPPRSSNAPTLTAVATPAPSFDTRAQRSSLGLRGLWVVGVVVAAASTFAATVGVAALSHGRRAAAVHGSSDAAQAQAQAQAQRNVAEPTTEVDAVAPPPQPPAPPSASKGDPPPSAASATKPTLARPKPAAKQQHKARFLDDGF